MAVFWDKTVPIPKTNGITINRGDKNKVLFVKEAPYDANAIETVSAAQRLRP